MTLSELLKGLREADWDKWIYVPAEGDPVGETPCLVLGQDKALNDVQFPIEAERLGYREFLAGQDLLMVRENLRQQRPRYTADDLVAATLFYFRNDAYVDVARGDLT